MVSRQRVLNTPIQRKREFTRKSDMMNRKVNLANESSTEAKAKSLDHSSNRREAKRRDHQRRPIRIGLEIESPLRK